MKILVLKMTFFLCLLAAFSLSAQSVTDKTVAIIDTSSQDPLPFTGSMPLMSFDKKTINFGNIKTGDKPEVIYHFTNIGNKELDIEIVSACECTELEWTQTTVKVGEKGFIKAIFESEKTEDEDHKKPLKKTIDIILKQTHPSNDYPLVESVTFEVFIVD